jgi:catechol 2,3-dioxygenase-like lactoylglutathione lyase family enzyme
MNGIHHVAYTCRDLAETHRFYHDLLGLPLINVESTENPDGSWFRHVFYQFGDGTCIAFFKLEGFGEPTPLKTAVSTDLGLPVWANHLAVRVDADTAKEISVRLKEAGWPKAMDVDHGWAHSRYYLDPNGILIELCTDTPGMPTSDALDLEDAVGDSAQLTSA